MKREEADCYLDAFSDGILSPRRTSRCNPKSFGRSACVQT